MMLVTVDHGPCHVNRLLDESSCIAVFLVWDLPSHPLVRNNDWAGSIWSYPPQPRMDHAIFSTIRVFFPLIFPFSSFPAVGIDVTRMTSWAMDSSAYQLASGFGDGDLDSIASWC